MGGGRQSRLGLGMVTTHLSAYVLDAESALHTKLCRVHSRYPHRASPWAPESPAGSSSGTVKSSSPGCQRQRPECVDAPADAFCMYVRPGRAVELQREFVNRIFCVSPREIPPPDESISLCFMAKAFVSLSLLSRICARAEEIERRCSWRHRGFAGEGEEWICHAKCSLNSHMYIVMHT